MMTFLLSEFLKPSFDADIPLYAAVVPVGVDVFTDDFGDVGPAAGATLKLEVNGSDFTTDLRNADITSRSRSGPTSSGSR